MLYKEHLMHLQAWSWTNDTRPQNGSKKIWMGLCSQHLYI